MTQSVASPHSKLAYSRALIDFLDWYDGNGRPGFTKATINVYREELLEFGKGRGYHLSLTDKRETDSVEGGKAELRHYLTRLVRKSRCFSRSLTWLNRHVKAFAHA